MIIKRGIGTIVTVIEPTETELESNLLDEETKKKLEAAHKLPNQEQNTDSKSDDNLN